MSEFDYTGLTRTYSRQAACTRLVAEWRAAADDVGTDAASIVRADLSDNHEKTNAGSADAVSLRQARELPLARSRGLVSEWLRADAGHIGGRNVPVERTVARRRRAGG